MELHLFVNWERENLFLARQRGAVMAFTPDPGSLTCTGGNFHPTVISMAFPPEPLVEIQNNFTELFLMMPSISSPSSKNM